MKDQAPIPRSEYATLSPVERHAKLVELYQLFPKSDSHAEYKAASDKESELVKEHTEVLKDESKNDEAHREAYMKIAIIYRDNRDNLDELEKKGDQERERRANSEDKKLLLGKVSGLLGFSPTTDEFKQVVIEFFSYDYDDGRDSLNNPDGLSRAILVEKAQSGGFFNQQQACDIEVLSYREKKLRLEIVSGWNNLLEHINDRSITDKVLGIHMEAKEEDVMFLEKWEQAIKDRYHVEKV